MRRTWRRPIAATGPALLLLLFIAVGCAGDTTDEDRALRSESTETQYVLLDHPEWRMQEAFDYRAGLGQLGRLEPDLDWYAGYEGPRVDHGDGSFTIPALSISGHTAGLEERTRQLPGFEFQSEEVGGREALVAEAAAGSPYIVLVELGTDYSITILSYDDVVDVREFAGLLVPVEEQEWIAAGGRMLDCVPLEPGCGFDE